MFKFSNGMGEVALYISADGEENNTLALVGCARFALIKSGEIEKAIQVEQEFKTSLQQGADREELEKVIRKYTRLYIIEKKSPMYQMFFSN